MTDQAPGAAGQGASAVLTGDPNAGTATGGPAAGAAAAQPSGGTPPAGTPASPIPWLNGVDDATLGYVQNKGWSEPTQMLQSYQNLEKLLGADKANNAVILPKPDAPKAEVDAFYNRLGRPADPGGYKIEIPATGGDPEFAKTAATKFHELGLTQKQGEGLAAWFNEHTTGLVTKQQAQTAEQIQADALQLKTDWGAAHAQNMVAAQTAARGLGIDAATIDKMEQAMGHKAVMNLFYQIGSKMGEATFVTGNKVEPFGSAMTPGQAQARIRELQADKNFVARYVSKDAEAMAEMKRLHEFAFPEPQ